MVESIRAFIAIELSDEARARLAKLQDRLKAIVPSHTVRWTTPENIHLTLHFLGDIAVDKLDQISRLQQLSGSEAPIFSLTLSGLGCFPNTRRPRIVWTGVSGQLDALGSLHRGLGDRLSAIGYSPEARPYSPHLTIGRVKDGLPARQLTLLGETLAREQDKVGQLAKLNVVEIVLMQSELRPSGPIYTPLARAALNANFANGNLID